MLAIGAIAIGAIAGGCGPTTAPAFHRLEPDQQAQVDDAWRNMLSPPGRLDRELLLDVIVYNQFHQLGVDRADYRAEKELPNAGGPAPMRITFARRKPLDDHFFVEVRDAKQQL